MILDKRNEQGFVYSYIVFNVVDDNTSLTDEGKYCFVNGFWIHPEYRKNFKSILKEYIQLMLKHKTTQKVEIVYWERPDGRIRRFLASKFLNRR